MDETLTCLVVFLPYMAAKLTPTMAAAFGHAPVVSVLLRHGANPSLPGEEPEMLLLLVMRCRSSTLIWLICRRVYVYLGAYMSRLCVALAHAVHVSHYAPICLSYQRLNAGS